MTKKQKQKEQDIIISFADSMSTQDVTGSCLHVEYGKTKILIEAGLHHAHSMLEGYRANSRDFKFKVKELDYVFLPHCHIDHIGRVPLLYKMGATAKVIIPSGSSKILRALLLNCAMILNGDARMLSKKLDKEVEPIYTETDVHKMMEYVVEYNMYENIILDDKVSFKYISSGHVAKACSLILNIDKNGVTKKIFYTSDLGNIKFKSYYTNNMDKIKNADVVISECTYGDKSRSCGNSEQRQKDIEKIKHVVEHYCIGKKGKVLIPVFSFSRSQSIATLLYDIYRNDPKFEIPIYMDSVLLIEMNKIFRQEFPYFTEVMAWKNIHEIDKTARKELMQIEGKAIILASAGMLNAGASISWLRSLVESSKNCVVFCGYCSEGTLGAKLKLKTQKTITIFGEKYKNKIEVVKLNSFSSHIQYDDLLSYLSDINCQTVALHHGEQEVKLGFKADLEKEYEDSCKTTKVIVPNKSTKIRL